VEIQEIRIPACKLLAYTSAARKEKPGCSPYPKKTQTGAEQKAQVREKGMGKKRK